MNPESPMFQDEYPDAYRLAQEANEVFRTWKKAEAYASSIGNGNSRATDQILALRKEQNRLASIEEEKFESRKFIADVFMPELPAD